MLVAGGSCRQIPALLKSMGYSRPLIVTDQFLANSGALDTVVNPLAKEDVRHSIWAESMPEPNTLSLDGAVEALKAGNHDSIIALGGGSPMDTAKAAAVLHTHGGKMSDYKAPVLTDEETIPIIAVPTTAGTGSEVTRFTIVTDSDTDEKMLCIGRAFLPVAAVVDYELTLSMPYRLTADTGIDALCHAMEAYVSRKNNPFSDQQSLHALSAIGGNLVDACNEPENHKAREAVMLASTNAGMAFSNSSVTIIHGMSRPIGARFHVPHGMSNAMLCPILTEFSLPGAVSRYADCARALGMCPVGVSDEDAAAALPVGLQEMCTTLQVPTFQDFGIKADQFHGLKSTMAEAALASGSPNNNPVIPTQQEVEDLYQKIWASGEAK